MKAHFGQTTPSEQKQFIPKSLWEPDLNTLPISLLHLIEKDLQTIKNLQQNPDQSNLSPQEEQAILQLLNNKSIIIKPADKGSATVIMDRTDYVHEALRQLSNSTYYKPLREPIFHETRERILVILASLHKKKFLSKKQITYLMGESPPSIRSFYLLPKIHKPPEKWTIPHRIPPGRPIVSDCGSESYGVAEYIESFLTPLSTRHPSYIKNTQDFLHRIQNTITQEPCFLFTMDVNNLYTNIDIPLGMESIQKCLQKYPDEKRPDEELLELLHLSLLRNDFQFDNKHYLQVKGTAMGKRFAPAYANIYMADWEETAFRKCNKTPTLYLRYLDDIFGIWTHSLEDFQEFTNILNNHHTHIKIETTTHPTEIHFLDITTFKDLTFNSTGILNTKIYFKPTDTHSLLHKDSHHPRHVFRGIIKSQLLRFYRYCSKRQDAEEAEQTLFKTLLQRGYSRSFLRKVRKEILDPSLNPPSKQDDRQIIPLISEFSEYTRAAHYKLKSNFQQILQNTTLGEKYRIISAFKKDQSLRDILVRAKLKPILHKTRLPETHKIAKNQTTGTAIPLPRNIPLTTSNCIYILRCKRCPMQYIGETRNSLRTRLSHHRYNVRNGHKINTHLVQHFRRHGLKNMVLQGLQHDPNWSTGQRKKTEKQWIKRLSTIFPYGLNEKDIS